MAQFIPLIAAVIAAGASVYSSRQTAKAAKQVPDVPVVPPVPEITDTNVEEAARKETLAQRQRRGRAATILTSMSGLQDQATLGKATLLGH